MQGISPNSVIEINIVASEVVTSNPSDELVADVTFLGHPLWRTGKMRPNEYWTKLTLLNSFPIRPTLHLTRTTLGTQNFLSGELRYDIIERTILRYWIVLGLACYFIFLCFAFSDIVYFDGLQNLSLGNKKFKVPTILLTPAIIAAHALIYFLLPSLMLRRVWRKTEKFSEELKMRLEHV